MDRRIRPEPHSWRRDRRRIRHATLERVAEEGLPKRTRRQQLEFIDGRTDMLFRARAERHSHFCCRPPGPLARRERRAITGAVCEERATKPAGLSRYAREGRVPSEARDPRRCPTSAASRRLHLPARRSRQNDPLQTFPAGGFFCLRPIRLPSGVSVLTKWNAMTSSFRKASTRMRDNRTSTTG